MQQPIEVRAGDGAPSSRPVTDRAGLEDLLRELAPQVLGALVRRYGDFAAAEDAVQEALLAAAALAARRACRTTRAAGWSTTAVPADDRPAPQRGRPAAARGRSPRSREPPAGPTSTATATTR